jgi:hypothetical protein
MKTIEIDGNGFAEVTINNVTILGYIKARDLNQAESLDFDFCGLDKFGYLSFE